MARWTLALLAMALPACGHEDQAPARAAPQGGAMADLTLTSPAFEDGGSIPRKYTCQGDDVSPPLAWSGVPDGAKSLALVVDDPDAPDPAAPKMVWDHWVLYNLPPTAGGLPEAVAPAALPEGTRQGTNSWDRTGYGGPCPPRGRHRYRHTLYALDTTLDLDAPTKDELQAAMKGHVLAQDTLVGTYEK